MNRRKRNASVALAVIFFICFLAAVQKYLMPREKTPVPKHLVRPADGRLMLATEKGLSCDRRNARHVVYAAAAYAAKGRPQTAEAWLKLGAVEYKYPSVMLFYGDYLVSQKKWREARHWYAAAAECAARDGEKQFYRYAGERITAVERILRKEAKK